MTDLLQSSLWSPNLAYEFITLILAMIVIILCLRIVWRVEKRLDTFFKVFTTAHIVLFVRQLLKVLVTVHLIELESWMLTFDVLFGVLLISSLVIMNNLITGLSRPKK